MPNAEQQSMNVDELESAVDRWGANLDDWPPEEALRAKMLLSEEASDSDKHAARVTLDAASALDSLFARTERHVTTPGLANRIQTKLATNDGWFKLVDWFRGALWRPTIALAVPVSLGFLIGLTVPLGTVDFDEDGLQEELSWIAFTTDYDSQSNGTNTELGDQP